MPDSGDRAELILQVNDLISPNVAKIATALDRANVAMGGSDKAVTKLEASFGRFVGVLSDVAKSAGASAKSTAQLGASASAAAAKTNAAYRSMAAAATEYQAQANAAAAAQARMSTSRVNTAGRTIAPNGQFISSATAIEASRATATIARAEASLDAVERQRVSTLTQMNGLTGIQKTAYVELASATNQSTASLRANLTAQQAVTEAQRRGLITAQQAARASTMSAVSSTAGATRVTGNPTGFIGPTTAGASAAQMRQMAAATKLVATAQGEAVTASSRFGAALGAIANSSNSARYALYSVAQGATRAGVEMLALPVIAAVVSASFDREFANVARASAKANGGFDVNLKALRASLVSMSEVIPVSFKDLTDIATLGAQLGVRGTKGLTSFTRTVAELSATTNLTADAAGTLLGRFLAVNAIKSNQFDRLASSILNVGVNSAATESQIAGIATQIVGIGKIAGFTSPQIIGLSGAIASVSSNGAALARGAITRFVTVLQAAVETGGPALDAFADTAHVSAMQVQRDWGTSKFSGDFQRFFQGLSEKGNEANQVLIQMGITSVRDIPLFLNLANGWKTLNGAMKDSQQGWNDTNIIAIHYAQINDTLVSKVKELGNTFMASMDAMGKSSNSGLIPIVDGLTDLLKIITDVVSTPIGGFFAALALGGLTVFGALSLLLGAFARMAAGIQAMRVAFTEAKAAMIAYDAATITSTGTTGVASVASRVFAGTLGTVGVSARAAAVGVGILGDAIKAASVVGLVFVGLELLKPVAEGASTWIREANGLTNSTKQVKDAAAQGVTALNKLAEFSRAGNQNGQGALAGWTNLFYKTGDGLKGFAGQLKELDDSWLKIDLGGAGDKAKQLDAALASLVNSGNTRKASEEFAQLAAGYKANGGTLTDLVKRFPEYQKALQDAKSKSDTFSSSVDRQNQSLAQTNTLFQALSGMDSKAFDKYVGSVQKSIAPLLDFNSVAGQVQSALEAQAQAQADAAGGNAKASDYYDGVSVSLQQMTDQYNTNTATATQWLSDIQTVAATYGTDIANQFIQAGYSVQNNSILQKLIDATPEQGQQYADAMRNAINQGALAAGEALILAGGLVTNDSGQIGSDMAAQMGAMLLAGFSPADIMGRFNLQFGQPGNKAQPQVSTENAQRDLDQWIARNSHFEIAGHAQLDTGPASYELNQWISANNGRRIKIYQDVATGTVQNFGSLLGGYGVGYTGGYYNGGTKFLYDTGGYTGHGAKYTPAGIVHKGEFVFNKESTNAYGVPFLMNMMRGFRGAQGRGYAGGGPVGLGVATQGVPTVALDAGTLMALAQMQNVTLYLDGKQLTASNNANNVVASNRREN